MLVHYTLCFCSHLIDLQNAGANRDVCHQVSVKSDGHDNICLNAGDEDFFAPLRLCSRLSLQPLACLKAPDKTDSVTVVG